MKRTILPHEGSPSPAKKACVAPAYKLEDILVDIWVIGILPNLDLREGFLLGVSHYFLKIIEFYFGQKLMEKYFPYVLPQIPREHFVFKKNNFNWRAEFKRIFSEKYENVSSSFSMELNKQVRSLRKMLPFDTISQTWPTTAMGILFDRKRHHLLDSYDHNHFQVLLSNAQHQDMLDSLYQI